MRIRRTSTGIRWLGRVLNPAFVVAWLGVLLATLPLVAQQDPTLDDLQFQTVRYRAAEDAYQAALTAREVVQLSFDASLDSVRVARDGGNQEAFDRASEQNMLMARDLSRMDLRVEETSDSLQTARRDLLESMDSRVTVLLERQDSASTRGEAERIGALITDLYNQYRDLENSSEILTPKPVVLTGVLVYTPRDTPSRLSQKIELATRRIEDLQDRLDETDDRILGIEQRIRLARQSDNFQSSLGRFDDTNVPVGPPGQSRSQGDPAVTDSTGVRTQPQSLEDQLGDWQELKVQLEALLESMLAVREELRGHVGAAPEMAAAGAV